MNLKEHMVQALASIWSGKVTTKSDLARTYADEIAEAASRGWISTAILNRRRKGPPLYGRQWRMTSLGLIVLEADQSSPHCNKKRDTQGNGTPSDKEAGQEQGQDRAH